MCGAVTEQPPFICDSPRFLLRQRARAVKALVSEHAWSSICPCQKCKESAKQKLHVTASTSSGDLGVPTRAASRHATLGPRASFAARDPGASRVQTAAEPALETKDFSWLLQTVFEFAAQPPTPEQPSGKASLVPSDEHLLLMAMRARMCAIGHDVRAVLRDLCLRFPDTIIIKRGKPEKRFDTDVVGKLQVTRMKNSAELFRVLVEFVRRAEPPRGRSTRRLAKIPTKADLPAAPALEPWAIPRPVEADAAVLYYGQERAPAGTWYHGRAEAACASRVMSCAEARAQTTVGSKGACKLKRDFWQHIRMMQVPVQMHNGRLRHVTYAFNTKTEAPRVLVSNVASAEEKLGGVYRLSGNANRRRRFQNASGATMEYDGEMWTICPPNSEDAVYGVDSSTPMPPSRQWARISYGAEASSAQAACHVKVLPGAEPQAPCPLGSRRSMSAPSLRQAHSETAEAPDNSRFADVPRRINGLLAGRRRGEPGSGRELVSGVLDFVVDDFDGTMWLVDASQLRLVQAQLPSDSGLEESAQEEFRYFREDEFATNMNWERHRFTGMKRLFGESPGQGGTQTAIQRMSAEQQKMPDDLEEYYECEKEMQRFYELEIQPAYEAGSGSLMRSLHGERPPNVRLWFFRWAKVVREACGNSKRRTIFGGALSVEGLSVELGRPASRPLSAAGSWSGSSRPLSAAS